MEPIWGAIAAWAVAISVWVLSGSPQGRKALRWSKGRAGNGPKMSLAAQHLFAAMFLVFGFIIVSPPHSILMWSLNGVSAGVFIAIVWVANRDGQSPENPD
jgi:hypothetical protein